MDAYAAIIERQGGEFVLDNVSIEDPRDGEVLVKIAAAGMCHTDLTVRDQYYPSLHGPARSERGAAGRR